MNGDAGKAPWLRRTSSRAVRGFLRIIWGLKISGLERVPEAGPVIVACNHASLMDGPLIAAALDPRRYLRFLGKAELFSIPVLGWYLRKAGAFPLDRRGEVTALRIAMDILGEGGCFALFPEGTRSRTGQPGRARAGIGFLAGKTGALVVPARLVNTDRVLSLAPLEVRFGEGMRFAGDPSNREECLAFAEVVMRRIFAL